MGCILRRLVGQPAMSKRVASVASAAQRQAGTAPLTHNTWHSFWALIHCKGSPKQREEHCSFAPTAGALSWCPCLRTIFSPSYSISPLHPPSCLQPYTVPVIQPSATPLPFARRVCCALCFPPLSLHGGALMHSSSACCCALLVAQLCDLSTAMLSCVTHSPPLELCVFLCLSLQTVLCRKVCLILTRFPLGRAACRPRAQDCCRSGRPASGVFNEGR